MAWRSRLQSRFVYKHSFFISLFLFTWLIFIWPSFDRKQQSVFTALFIDYSLKLIGCFVFGLAQNIDRLLLSILKISCIHFGGNVLILSFVVQPFSSQGHPKTASIITKMEFNRFRLTQSTRS